MILLILLYFFVAAYFLLINFRRHGITPPVIFVGMQFVMFLGITKYVDFSVAADRRLLTIYFSALFFFSAGTALMNLVVSPRRQRARAAYDPFPSRNQNIRSIILICVSVVVCLWFFYQRGYNVFLFTLRSLMGGTVANVGDMRSAYTQMSGVGYVGQFRTIVLPLLTMLFMFGQRGAFLRRIGYLLLPVTTVFLLGTGQRGAFFVVVVIGALYSVMLGRYTERKVRRTTAVLLLGAAILLFAIMTVFNGRVANTENLATGALDAIMRRFFDDNQQVAVIAFRYIDGLPTVWGKDWFNMMKDVLPGKNQYLSLDYVVFRIMYGSTRGTAPPCIWASAWYNWNVFGVTAFPAVLGFVYQGVYWRFKRGSTTAIRLLLYTALFYLLGQWIVGGPVFLFNNGVITVATMLLLLGGTYTRKEGNDGHEIRSNRQCRGYAPHVHDLTIHRAL